MYICNGRFVRLVELCTDNNRDLFTLMKDNEDDYRRFVSDQAVPESYESFIIRLNEWLQNGRIYQFLVSKKRCGEKIGTVFFYDYHHTVYSTTKFSVFFVESARKSVFVAEALGLTVIFAKEILLVEQLMFSVYKENIQMHKIAKKLGLKPIHSGISVSNNNRLVLDYVIDKETIDEILQKLRILNP